MGKGVKVTSIPHLTHPTKWLESCWKTAGSSLTGATPRVSTTSSRLQEKAFSEVKMATRALWKCLPYIWDAAQVPMPKAQVPGQSSIPRIRGGLLLTLPSPHPKPNPKTQITALRVQHIPQGSTPMHPALLIMFSPPAWIQARTVSFCPELKTLVSMLVLSVGQSFPLGSSNAGTELHMSSKSAARSRWSRNVHQKRL